MVEQLGSWVEAIAQSTKNILQTICNTKGWEIIEMYVMEDHIHLFIFEQCLGWRFVPVNYQ